MMMEDSLPGLTVISDSCFKIPHEDQLLSSRHGSDQAVEIFIKYIFGLIRAYGGVHRHLQWRHDAWCGILASLIGQAMFRPPFPGSSLMKGQQYCCKKGCSIAWGIAGLLSCPGYRVKWLPVNKDYLCAGLGLWLLVVTSTPVAVASPSIITIGLG